MDIQLKKGLLEVCVLAVVEWQDCLLYTSMLFCTTLAEITPFVF